MNFRIFLRFSLLYLIICCIIIKNHELYTYEHDCKEVAALSHNAAIMVLKHRIHKELIGQPVALSSIQETFRKNFENFTLGVPLSLHLSGPSGTGKSHACKLIAESLYTMGLESMIVHKFEGKDLFRNEDETEYYKEHLRMYISFHLSECNRSLFIFENVEKIPPKILEVMRPFLNSQRGGLFIFTTTKVNPEIIALYKKLRNEGVKKTRYPVEKYKQFDETMTYSTAKYLIAKNATKTRASLRGISEGLEVDHLGLLGPNKNREYRLRTTAQAIFLPLEHRELKFCMLDEFERLGRFVPSDCELQKVYDIMDYENHRDDLVSCKDVIQITQWVVNNGDC